MSKWLRISAVLYFASIIGGATTLTFMGTGLSDGGVLTTYGSNMTGPCTGSGQQGCVSQGNGFTPDIAVSFSTLSQLNQPCPLVSPRNEAPLSY